MAFLVYRKTRMAGEWEYQDPKNVVLAGRGLIQSACRRHLTGKNGGWTISANDMLAAGGFTTEDHAVVVDTSPSRSTINLFEITSVCGFSYATWTPIMLAFEQLFANAEDELIIDDGSSISTDVFKSRFKDGTCERCVVRSILYLRGGHEGGDWNWGGNSRTTAALLWDDAWEFCKTVHYPAGHRTTAIQE